MLSIGKFGPDRSEYFAENCADSPAGYHIDGGRSVGRWKRGYADDFGLCGSQVTTEQLERLFNAKHPATGAQLRPVGRTRTSIGPQGNIRTHKPRTVFDLTYSAPKSLSLFLLSSDPAVRSQVLSAHEAAIDVAQEWLVDEFVWARPKTGQEVHRRHVGRAQRLDFLHFDSREGDPQLHTHSLLANTVWADSRWRTLDSATLHRASKAAGAIYQAALRSEATQRLGVSWTEVSANCQADVAGIPADLLSNFSKRTKQINDAVTEMGVDCSELTRSGESRLRDAATQSTRQKKDTSESLEQAIHRWTEEAEDAGFNIADVLEQAAAKSNPTESFNPEIVALAACEALKTKYATFPASKAIEAIVVALPPTSGRSAVEADEIIRRITERVFDQPDVFAADRERLVIDNGHIWPGCQFTTSQIIEDEVTILQAVMDGAAQRHSELDRADVLARAKKALGDGEQAEVVAQIASDGNQFSLLNAPAGCGKTTLDKVLVEAYQHAGHRVIGLAPSKSAAMELATATGLDTWGATAKLFYEYDHSGGPRKEWRLRKGDVVILDEASLCSTPDLRRLVTLCGDLGAKLLLQGDTHQIQAIDAGGIGKALHRYLPSYSLEKVRRFKNDWEAVASLDLRQGRPEAIQNYSERGRLFIGSKEFLSDKIVERWAGCRENQRSFLAIAHSEQLVSEINQKVRALRREKGELIGHDFRLGPRLDVAVNDEIITKRNSPTIRTSTGHSVCNGNRWRITGADHGGSLQVESLEGHGTVSLPAEYLEKPDNVRLGYAVNVWGAQGATVDEAVALVTPGMSRSMIYVAGSRGRHLNEFFVVDDPSDPSRSAEDILVDAIARDDRDTSAFERICDDALGRPLDAPPTEEVAPHLTESEVEALTSKRDQDRRASRQAAAAIESCSKRTAALDAELTKATGELAVLIHQRAEQANNLGSMKGGRFGAPSTRRAATNLQASIEKLDAQTERLSEHIETMQKEKDGLSQRETEALSTFTRSTSFATVLDTRLRIDAEARSRGTQSPELKKATQRQGLSR